MKGPGITPSVKLIGQDGNAFFIMGRVSDALKKSGADEEYVKKYFKESTAGNYDHLLQTAMKFVNVV